MLSELETGVSHAVDFPENRSAPIFIEVTRGGMVESIHRGICVISDSRGSIYKSWGDHERPIYPRSAIKPLQAIPVVASGAAAALKMSGAELALCCASPKMGFRYGFWRTKLVRRHANRLSLRELLPWFGLITTLLMLGLGFIYWYIPIVLYLAVLFSEGIRATLNSMRISHLLGVPLAITILHTSFSVGLLYGLFGKPKSFNDRESNSGNIN